MRGQLTFLILLVGVLMVLPPGATFSSAIASRAEPPRSAASVAEATALPAGGAPSSTSLPITSFHAWNTTLAPSQGGVPRSADGVPVSAVLDTPPVALPGTVPTILYLLNQSDGCCFERNVSVPTGPWGRVILNFTGTAVGDVYDSSYRAFLGGVQVMFGTSPEYGTWTVAQDVTPYVSLLHGSVNVTFLFGEALLGGHFVVNLSLAFYPPAPGTAPPPTPNDVVPLWLSTAVTPGDPTLRVNATLPDNVTNATLELWAYGFNPDEFWYSTMPDFRSFDVSIDGTPVASVLPFPYINTGGINLFLWRPIPAVFTTSDRPYQFDVTPLLGLLAGTHQYNATLTGISANSRWILSGALLLNTSANVSYAIPGTSRAFQSVPHITRTAATYDEASNDSYAWSSQLYAPDGAVTNVQGTLRDLFTSNITLGGSVWENISLGERMVESVTATSPSGGWWDNRSLNFTLDVDLGEVSVVTKTTNGSYPEYVNFTESFLQGLQSWQESDLLHLHTGAQDADRSTNLSNILTGANGVYSGTEELTSANAGQITAISSINSLTPELSTQTLVAEGLTGSFSHAVTGAAVDPPGPNNVESITLDEVGGSVGATLDVSAPTLDVGQNVTLLVHALGGAGRLLYTWSGLPTGCSSVSAPTLVCSPTAAGSFSPNVTVEDSVTGHATVASALLQVEAPLDVRWIRAPTESDAGATASYNVSVTGGLGPYVCSWSVNDLPAGSPVPCAQAFNVTWQGPAPTNQTLTVHVTDGLGGSNRTMWTVAIQPSPSVVIGKVTANATPLVPGSAVELFATASNGTRPYVWSWFRGSAAAGAGAEGAELNWTPSTPGTYSFTAEVTDAAGEQNISAVWVVQVLESGSSHPSTAPSTGGWTALDDLLVLGGASAVVALVAAFVVYRGGRERPPGRTPSPPHAS